MRNHVNRILNFMKSIISAAFACAALLAVNPNSEIIISEPNTSLFAAAYFLRMKPNKVGRLDRATFG